MHGFFITGTNTDTGKTLTTATILRLLRQNGKDAVAAKPVQTGVLAELDGCALAPDMEVYRQASGFSPSAEDLPLCFQYGFEPACSPHLAARLAGVRIDLAEVARKLALLGERHDCVLVEGAGGALVPLNEQETLLDLMRLLNLPVILTADNKLGMINHALLTLQALRAARIQIEGVIINHVHSGAPKESYLLDENIRAVEGFGKVRILGVIPHFPNFSPEREEDWERVCTCLRPGILSLR